MVGPGWEMCREGGGTVARHGGINCVIQTQFFGFYLYGHYQAAARDIEKTMLVSFDIKFIRRALKQGRNGEACSKDTT